MPIKDIIQLRPKCWKLLSFCFVLFCLLFSVPSGLCSLHLAHMNSSSISVSWDSAYGEFDFHRVTVANTSATNTLTIPKEERVAVVTGLVDGCSYDVSAVRVRGMTAGSAASLSVTTGRRCNITPLLSPALFCLIKFSLLLFFSLPHSP